MSPSTYRASSIKHRVSNDPRLFFLICFVTSIFLLINVSHLYAQRSIFRSVGDQKSQATGDKRSLDSARDGSRDGEPVEPQATEKKQDTSKPLLDPKSLLGDRPKTLAQSIQIPPEYGRISETHEGSPKPLIIHIQDVHVHYEAQKNLANILDKLVKENGLQLILVEGGSGDTSLSFLRAEATKEKRLEVAEKYLKLGKISGEEYLDIISDNPISLWGIEKEGLYDKNLDIFFKVDAVKGKALERAQGLKKIVEALKAHMYSSGIKELEQKKHDYEEGKVQAVDYYQYLGGFAQSQNVDLSRYPNFKNFLHSSLLEKVIDFQKVDGQHQSLIGKLTQVLSKEDLTVLAEKGLKYKLNEAGPGDYYGFLKELLAKSDPAPGTHQDLDRYIDYVILYADRDHVELFREGRILEKEIKGKLYTSEDERTLSEISDKLDLLFNFLELNLSPDDLKAYQADRKSFLVKGWKPFLLEKMDQYQLSLVFPMDISAIDDHWSLLESFYKFGLERDNALVENALTKMNDEKVDLAVLIAGGFHTEQITRLLREQNYSYIVVAPKITQASDLELYHKILKEKAGPESPADENLRQVPAIERGVAGDFVQDAQDGSDQHLFELTVEEARRIEREDLKILLSDQHVLEEEIVRFSIPHQKKVVVIELEEGDADFYAGNFLNALKRKKNEILYLPIGREAAEGKEEEILDQLKRELHAFKPEVIFLPLHTPILEDAVREAMEGKWQSSIGIFYKSTEIENRGLYVPFSPHVAKKKNHSILAHQSQHRLRGIRYDLMAYTADKARGLELGDPDLHAEAYGYTRLKGGKYLYPPKGPVLWNAKKIEEMKDAVMIAFAAHPDDVSILAGGFVHLAAKAGLKIQIWVLSTGSGGGPPGMSRLEVAEMRAREEKESARLLGIPEPRLLGYEILKSNPDMSDDEIVAKVGERLPGYLNDFMSGALGSVPRKGRTIVLLNDKSDPHPRHRAAYQQASRVLQEFSREEGNKNIEFELLFLTPPEVEDVNAFFTYRRTETRRSSDRRVARKHDAANFFSFSMGKIATETLLGKGSTPSPSFSIKTAEAYQIRSLHAESAQDGAGKESRELAGIIRQLEKDIAFHSRQLKDTENPAEREQLAKAITKMRRRLHGLKHLARYRIAEEEIVGEIPRYSIDELRALVRDYLGLFDQTLKELSEERLKLNTKDAKEKVSEANRIGRVLYELFSLYEYPPAKTITSLASELATMDIDRLKGYVGGHFETRVRQFRDLLTRFARDGGKKIPPEQIVGDPTLVTVAEDADIGKGVIFDVTEKRGQIIIQAGAKVKGWSYLKASRDNSVIVGENVEIDSSYLEGVFVEENASISPNAILVTSPEKGNWTFDREGRIAVSGKPTRVGFGAKVSGGAVLVNTDVGRETEIIGGFYANSEIGEKNRLSHTKMTLVHTEHEVTLKGTPELPLEVSEAWLGYGFRASEQAFIDSVLHTNEIVSLRFDSETRRLKVGKSFSLPAISHVGRGVVYSSYSGAPDPTKKHPNGLFQSQFGTAEGGNAPPIRILGIDGTESSAHGDILVDPLSILSPFLRWIALPGGRPSSDPLQLAQYTDLTHTMSFSVAGAPIVEGKGVDDWGLALSGAAKYGLRRSEVQIPFLFTYSPDTIFSLMKQLTDTLPPEEKSKYDDFVVEMLETGRALVQRELHQERQKFHEDQDQNRIARLEKWTTAYTAHIESGAWKFQNGESVGWRLENGEWRHERFDLRTLAQKVDGAEGASYKQKFYKDFLEKEPPIPFERWENYEPILTEAHLPKLGPSAVIGPEVVIEEGAVIRPGVILEGKTVLRKGAQVFGSHLKDVTVGERTFLWGVTLEETEAKEGTHLSSVFASKSHFGRGVRLASSRIEKSKIGDGTTGDGVLVKNSSVGRRNTLEPYATLVEVDSLDDSVIGSRVSHSRIAGLTDHHLASRILYLSALPISFYDEKGERHQVPNVTNWGGGSHVNPEMPGRVHADSAFVATNTPLGLPDTELLKAFEERKIASLDIRLGFGSIVSGGVKMGERLINLTDKRGPGPENDRIGGMLLRPDVVMRHIISKTKSAARALGIDPLLVDKLMEAKIKGGLQQAREELRLVESGETYHPYDGYKLHSKEQLEEGIELFEENLDGRWHMENHRFVNGFLLYDEDGRYSWHKIHEEGVQETQAGGEITFATDIGRGGDGQEDRVLVYSVPGWGDLLALIDGHGGEQTADLIKRKLPSVFSEALYQNREDVPAVLRTTFAVLDDLTKEMEPGATLSLVALRKEPDGRKSAFPAWTGDSPIMIVREDGSLFVSREHNSAFNEEERNAAVARGAFYNPNTRRLSRGYADRTALFPTRVLGNRKFRSILSQEPEIPEPIPLGEKSVLVLATDGLVTGLQGSGAPKVEQLVQKVKAGASAERLVRERLSDEDLADNVSAIVYRPTVFARDGAERYEAESYDPLVTKLPLHQQPYSKAFKSAAEGVAHRKGERILIFHSDILTQDLGESFSLALERLKEESRDSLRNVDLVFKPVLLIDDPQITKDQREAYLQKYHLRSNQFFDVVTHDMLATFDRLMESWESDEYRYFYEWELEKYKADPDLLYRARVARYLDYHLWQDGDAFSWGGGDRDANIAIIASETPLAGKRYSQADKWGDYMWRKRFSIGAYNLKAKLVIYGAPAPEEDLLNLAPLLVRTAAEFAVAKDPRKALDDLSKFLTVITPHEGIQKIYIDPVRITPDYKKAYDDYLRSV